MAMLFVEMRKRLQIRVLSKKKNVKVYFEKMRNKLKIIQLEMKK